MKILRWIAVAFSMYSRIPMPVFEWKDDDMSKGLMFLPLIGAVIGVCSVGIYYVATVFEIPLVVTMLTLGLLPLLITGGFHIDGYMDVTDALRSYQPKERKLEILKDPHIGAFAVIGVMKVMLTYGAGLGLLLVRGDLKAVICYGCSFVIVRATTGITSVTMNKAKKSGMLYEETKSSNNLVIAILCCQLLIALGIAVYINITNGILMAVTVLAVLAYYRYMTKKEFGGVTGDTAGYLVTIEETALVVVLGIAVWCGL